MPKPSCWFRHLGDCDGRLQRAHLIPKSYMKREFPHGAMRRDWDGHIAPQRRHEDFICGGKAWAAIPLDTVIWDPRCWTPMCVFHHGRFDNPNHELTIARADLPPGLTEFAREHLFLTRLDNLYGECADVRDAHARFLAS